MKSITDLNDSCFVLHYGLDATSIRSDVFIKSLEGISGALQNINDLINPLHDVQFEIEAIAPGSFKVQLKRKFQAATDLAKCNTAKAVLVGLLVNFTYDMIKDSPPVIVINTNEVIVNYNGEKVVIPREIRNQYEKIKENNDVKKNIRKCFAAVKSAPEIHEFGISRDLTDKKPYICIPNEAFSSISFEAPIPNRIVESKVEIEILRAILERSRRRWQFNYNGQRISAPITCKKFYNKFEEHTYEIAPGDRFSVKLEVYQELDEESNTYLNKKYTVTEVIDVIHSPRLAKFQKSFEGM